MMEKILFFVILLSIGVTLTRYVNESSATFQYNLRILIWSSSGFRMLPSAWLWSSITPAKFDFHWYIGNPLVRSILLSSWFASVLLRRLFLWSDCSCRNSSISLYLSSDFPAGTRMLYANWCKTLTAKNGIAATPNVTVFSINSSPAKSNRFSTQDSL